MVKFRWIQMSLFLILLPRFTAETIQLYDLRVEIGNDATMLCRDVTGDQGKCDAVYWHFDRNFLFLTEHSQELSRGRIIIHPEDKSHRLSVTEDCSLVIRKVTFEDTGYYTCLQSGQDRIHYLQSKVDLEVFIRITRPGSGNDAPSNVEVSKAWRNKTATEEGEETTTTTATTTTTTTTTATTTTSDDASSELPARTDCSVVDYIMLVLRVAELVLITVITVLLIRAAGNQRPPDDNTVPHDGGRHDSAANYENIGGPSAPARINTNIN